MPASLLTMSFPLHQKSGLKPGEPGKPWLNQTYQIFGNYQLKLIAWFSLGYQAFKVSLVIIYHESLVTQVST